MTARWTETLPPTVADRFVAMNDRDIDESGAFILYWMRTAARGHENPALDAAVSLGNAMGKPVLVYQAVSERFPYASDRHHAFMLQGAKAVAAELAARDIAHVVHVERPGHRGAHLKTLARRAVAIVTEAMPTMPMRRMAEVLAADAPVAMAQVDTACLLPMPLVGKPFTRAFAFRKATEKKRAPRIEAGWQDVKPTVAAWRPEGLPFEPVDIQSADLDALIAAAEIDHAVGPVADTPGGSPAGYARWADFRDNRLGGYAKRRNNAVDRHAVSRLSAYLHHGHVSPFRIAREAAAHGGPGAEKFLDELLVWRELAYTWCWHTRDHETVDCLPDWALSSLRAAEDDPRPDLLTWEEMARGQSGDRLWDAAQASLRIHGELHNNLRMTWGKAILPWTPDPETALERLIDLNHRYALDGRDPNSYGGLLWCLGQFDRPFEPVTPIFGAVRPRSTEQHAARLDLDRYVDRVFAPNTPEVPSVAVIGAGMAGLMAARTLADHGFPVIVYDKGRGVGGRLSTRRTDHGDYDHGANYFTARDPRFRRLVDSWREAGVVARWQPILATRRDDGWDEGPASERFVGVPGMSGIAKHLARDLAVENGVRIARIERAGGRYVPIAEDGARLPTVDRVIVAIPPIQAAALLEDDPDLRAVADAARMAPCWTVMAAFDDPVPVPADAVFDRRTDAVLGWGNRMSSKSAREPGERWVLQASPDWSRAHEEDNAADVTMALLDAFAGLADGAMPRLLDATAHRWRYALAETVGPAPAVRGASGLILAGDWVAGAKVEGAALSGQAAAGHILRETAFSATPSVAAEPEEIGPLFAAAQ